MCVRLSSLEVVPCLCCVGLDRHFSYTLQTAHLKVFGHLIQIPAELVCGWWSMERRVIPHGSEQRLVIVLILAVFVQALLIKLALGIFPCGASHTSPSYNTPPRGPLPFAVRPHHRFPLQCSVNYNAGPFYGHGTIWNLSCTGWRLSDDLPMRPGEPLLLTVALPSDY